MSLWTHQAKAVKKLEQFESFGLWYDMATGKSRCVVEWVNRTKPKCILIICPKTVALDVWAPQFEKWGTFPIRVEVLQGSSVAVKAKQLERALAVKGPLAVVVNYESAWRQPLGPRYGENKRRSVIVDPGLLMKQSWDAVILDESHRIKAPGGRASWFCSRLRKSAKKKICLSGTPAPHSPLDYYAQYRFLSPGLLAPNVTLFKRRYAVMGGYEGKQIISWTNLDELMEKIGKISLTVRVDDVLDLPPVRHEMRSCELEPKALKSYKDLERHYVTLINDGVLTASNALSRLLRLQQITGGFAPTDEDGRVQRVSKAKLDLLMDLIEDFPIHEPLVIFHRFTPESEEIVKRITEGGRTCGILSGQGNDLADWQTGKIDVLITQIQTGSLGIDLTRARYGIYYSLGFSLGEYEQSLARVRRPGQNHPVTYYHLTARGTVDEKIYRALEKKAEIIEYIIQGLKGGVNGQNA